ncbi:MAG: HypC/HybG/HupF family hydrogenase formation chaperone [Candidatus Omnitrophota bacterium]
MCLAVPAKIESVDKTSAIVDFGGTKRKISLGVLTGVKKGDHVLVHAGYAIGKVSTDEALDTLKVLDELKAVIREDIKKRR